MRNNLLPTLVVIALLAILVFLSDPFMLWMPQAGLMLLLLGVAILAAIWAGFVVYEKNGDEREDLHRMHAGRAAYLSGVAVLTLALIVQGLAHSVDPWISAALGVMVVVKLATRIYADRSR